MSYYANDIYVFGAVGNVSSCSKHSLIKYLLIDGFI